MIYDLLLKGIVTGLIISVMVGPAFFLLIDTSIRKGIRAGLIFDAGVITSDVLYMFIAYLFVQQVEYLSHGHQNALIRCIGGVLFLAYGYYTYRKKVEKVSFKDKKEGDKNNIKDYGKVYLKGFLLNLANPLVVFYWFSIMAFGHSGSSQRIDGFHIFLFMVFILGTFISIDVLKIIGAKKLRPFITQKFLQAMNHIIAIILFTFGLFLVINSIVLWLK